MMWMKAAQAAHPSTLENLLADRREAIPAAAQVQLVHPAAPAHHPAALAVLDQHPPAAHQEVRLAVQQCVHLAALVHLVRMQVQRLEVIHWTKRQKQETAR